MIQASNNFIEQNNKHLNLHAFISKGMKAIVDFDTDSLKIILDSGASAGFTHCLDDFISFRKYTGQVKGLGSMKIKGIGTVKYTIIDDYGQEQTLTIRDVYFVPGLSSRLISPQQVAQQYPKTKFSVGAQQATLWWNGNKKTVNLNKSSNLPILQTKPGTTRVTKLFTAAKSKKGATCFKVSKKTIDHHPLLQDELQIDEATKSSTQNNNNQFSQQKKLDAKSITEEQPPLLCQPIDTSSPPSTKIPTKKVTLRCKQDKCATCSANIPTQETLEMASTKNMSKDQRRLLQWHHKLNHLSWSVLQDLARQGFLDSRNLANVKPPVCIGCQIGKATKITAKKGKIIGEWVKNPGDMIHTDQAETTQPGRPLTHSGRNNKIKIFVFTIYYDSISKKGFVEFQHSTSAAETIKGKTRVERKAHQQSVSFKSFRADNGIFKSAEFRANLQDNNQDISFAAVGAHQMNGVAERFIRTLTERARASLLYASTQYEKGLPTELWTFAVKHALDSWNNTPRKDLGYRSPNEAFAKLKTRTSRKTAFENFHPFGCPVYVLDTKLRDGKSIPKWKPRSKMGIYLGQSDEHARSVALVLNPATDHISPQYHILYDDSYHTLNKPNLSDQIAIWTDISKTSVPGEKVDLVSEPYDASNIIQQVNQQQTSRRSRKRKGPDSFQTDNEGPSPQREQIQSVINDDALPPENKEDDACQRNDRPPKDITSIMSSPKEKVPSSKRNSHKFDPTKPSDSSGLRRSKRKRKPSAKLAQLLAHMTSLKTSSNKSVIDQINTIMDLTALPNGEINDTSPMAYAASCNPNILNHRDAMKADDVEHFLESMDDEMKSLFKNKIYELYPRSKVPRNQRVLRAVWSHRRKTKPTGEVYRHRSRICVDGSQQTHGVDYEHTYSPVVSWSTVRIMLIISVLNNLKTRQVDYVQAFPQASLSEGENVFMEIPRGYNYEGATSDDYVLKLRKNLYGLKQAAYNWHELLKAGLLKLGFKQSEHEPCLFLKKDITCLLYVDDTLFFSKSDDIIDSHINSLKTLGFDLTDEGDVENFLGVKVEKFPNNQIKMSQPSLIDTAIKMVLLENKSKCHNTPAVNPPLHEHKDGAERTSTWSYRSVIGILTYIARNTRPDIEYAVHQCARFQINPKKAHDNAVKRICRYLNGTRDKGVIFTPDAALTSSLQCYVDAGFAGDYQPETKADANSVRSRTGCVIMFAGCPITWFSRLQTEIALSTTEAEYIALSTAAREVIPMRELMIEIGSLFGLTSIAPTLKCTLFEDNMGAEHLAKSPKMTPRTKHIAIKYHHFREHVKAGTLIIERVDTENQLADIYTKAVPKPILTKLRKEIQGWTSLLSQQCILSEGAQKVLLYNCTIMK